MTALTYSPHICHSWPPIISLDQLQRSPLPWMTCNWSVMQDSTMSAQHDREFTVWANPWFCMQVLRVRVQCRIRRPAPHHTCGRLPVGFSHHPRSTWRVLPYACLHSSKVSDLPSPLPLPSLPHAVSLAPSHCVASHLVSPLGRLAHAVSRQPSRAASCAAPAHLRAASCATSHTASCAPLPRRLRAPPAPLLPHLPRCLPPLGRPPTPLCRRLPRVYPWASCPAVSSEPSRDSSLEMALSGSPPVPPLRPSPPSRTRAAPCAPLVAEFISY